MEVKIEVKGDDFYTCLAKLEDRVVVGIGFNEEMCEESLYLGVENVKKNKNNTRECEL